MMSGISEFGLGPERFLVIQASTAERRVRLLKNVAPIWPALTSESLLSRHDDTEGPCGAWGVHCSPGWMSREVPRRYSWPHGGRSGLVAPYSAGSPTRRRAAPRHIAPSAHCPLD